ncbi:MAG: Smr/MutS family protein [Xanthomonadales bacterium]|nr:Smr/MutS family protein [Xanthomonadales bacterium]
MKSANKPSDEELFRKAMADVEPLRVDNRIEPVPKMTPAIAAQRALDERAALAELLDGPDAAEDLETGEELSYLRPGYQKRLLRRLRRGEYSTAATIDLHHMNVDTARQVLLDFLAHALQRQAGCIRVIHGKGLRSRDLPRLKILTNQLLRKHPRVVAFASCRPVDGGTGATDVLLSLQAGRAK